MPSYTLHAPPGSFRAFPILISAEYNGIDIQVAEFDAKQVAELSPTGKAPVLETGKHVLFSSHAIARYVTNLRRDTGICGASILESASIDAWMDFASAELELPSCVWFYPVAGYMPFNQDAYLKAKNDFARGLATLESHLLSGREYLVGDQLTLADIVVVSTLLYPLKLVADPEYLAPYPNVLRWFKASVTQAEFVAVIGTTEMCKKELLAAGCSKTKAQPAPAAPETTSSSSSFDLNSWKSAYVADPTSKGTMEQFWSSYDKEEWSIWRCNYDYAEDNEDLEATKEIVTSFMKNTESVKDSCFGVMHVCGKLEIEGLWLFKGADPEVIFGANEDTSWFTWSQLGPDPSDKVKEAVAQIWSVDKVVLGKEIKDTQIFADAAGAAGGGFDLASWKSTFTNEDSGILDKSFWPIYNKEEWSIWRCTYDYADDNEELGATKEIVTSFMKNTESVKNSCFGVMHVCGKLEVEGLWLFKGADPEELFGANEDTSWFTWNQLGPDANDQVKAAVGKIWLATKDLNGKEIKDTQVFK